MSIAPSKFQIPQGWEQLPLGDVSDITNGKTNSQDAVVSGEYPLFDRSVSIKRSDKFLFDGEAVILPGEGAEFVPKYFSGKFDLHQRAYAIFANEEKLYPQYLFQFLFANRDIFAQTAVGSTVKSLRMPIIQRVLVDIPPIGEQKKIAEILSTVDEEIQITDEIIFATEKIKHGLMQKLFTKGIGNTKFKETKMGNIPDNWDLLSIKESGIEILDGDRGSNYPSITDFSQQGYCLFLSNKNIKNDSFVFRDSQFISEEKSLALRKGKLQRNDVVLTTRGTVGNVAFYDYSIPFENVRINSGMVLIRAGKEFFPDFVYHLFKSPLFKKRYAELTSGSAQPQLPIKNLEQILVPIPSFDEQRRIAEVSQSIDETMVNNQHIKFQLTVLKNGLMQDLLSGKVRVKK